MKRHLVLFILLIIYVKSQYTINTFIDYLQKKGYYEIIYEVKIAFGDDVSIDICKELALSSQCEEVVRVYMPSQPSGSNRRRAPRKHQIFEELDLSENLKIELEKIYESLDWDEKELILIILDYYYYLLENMDEFEFLTFIKIMLKNIKLSF